MKISLKGIYTILGKIEYKENTEFIFKISLTHNSVISVKILPERKQVEVFYNKEISKGLYKFINQDKKIRLDKASEQLKNEASSITGDMSNAVRKVLVNIKYWLRCNSLDEKLFSVKKIHWSKDNNKYKPFPYLITCTITSDFASPLDKKRSQIIRNYIGNNTEPFMALRHLHRAKNEQIPRYKWIDATIAAELAIKEFYITKKPELETLLLEIPSPPLSKLYGSILEKYIGERSPYAAKLQKGAEQRNKLLHRPEKEQISNGEAVEYIRTVEAAIYHLLKLLYPKDNFININFTNLE